MNENDSSRRKFLVGSMTGVSAAWIAANWPTALAAAERAAASGRPAEFAFFTPAQGADVEAMTAQIFPTDDTPGAREAQVVYFIDLGLMSFARDAQPIYTQGLADLQTKTRQMFAGAAGFSALTAAQQIQVLTAIEKTPFFRTVRNHTIMGMFADPRHGGNYEKIGWKLIGFDDSLNFKAPFGYYDR